MRNVLSISAMALGLAACGGGGGGGGGTSGGSGVVAGLDMPVSLSVVVAQDSGSGKAGGAGVTAALITPSTLPVSSDYVKDPQHAWVQDRALQPMAQVNTILCYINQTRADELVNKTYIALINEKECEREGESQSGQQDQSSGGSDRAVAYSKWIVKSTRVDNDSPQTVQIWAPDSGGQYDPAMTIKAELTMYEGVTDADPYGKFILNYASVLDADFDMTSMNGPNLSAGDKMMEGTLRTVDAINGKIGFTLYENSPWDGARKVSVVTDADLATGIAFTAGQERNNNGDQQESAFAVGFNSDQILVYPQVTIAALDGISNVSATEVEADDGACLARSLETMRKNIWRYDLYDAISGERVAVNSGFPFVWTDDNSQKHYGWAGYWGIWSEQQPAGGWAGQAIVKESFGQGNSTPETYVVTQSDGKLIRSAKDKILLTDLDATVFNGFRCITANSYCGDVKIEFDNNSSLGNTAGFYVTHTLQYQPDSPPVETPVTPAELISFSTDPWLGMWSQVLGGSVNYDSQKSVVGTSNDYVTFYKESFVNSSHSVFSESGNYIDVDGNLLLDCYTNCLKPNIDKTMYTDTNFPSSAFYPDAADGQNPTPAATYKYIKDTMALEVVTPSPDVGLTVKLADGISFTDQEFQPWGIASSAMVPAGTVVNQKWDTWDKDVTFRFETGHETWNKMFALKNTNTQTVVAFDPPLSFSYKFSSVDDANAGTSSPSSNYYGQTFLMEYAGNGDLRGIPWIDTSGGNNNEWRPGFALEDGVLMGPDGNNYVLKAREMELKPDVTTGQCGALVLNQPAAPLPSAVDGEPSHINTAAPTPDDESPAVIGGELQSSSTP